MEIKSRPYYDRAYAALKDAHNALYKEFEGRKDLSPIAMSHGPFSGVNEVLGIVDELEYSLNILNKKISQPVEASRKSEDANPVS